MYVFIEKNMMFINIINYNKIINATLFLYYQLQNIN